MEVEPRKDSEGALYEDVGGCCNGVGDGLRHGTGCRGGVEHYLETGEYYVLDVGEVRFPIGKHGSLVGRAEDSVEERFRRPGGLWRTWLGWWPRRVR